jgi:hypothetical protein
MLSATAKVGILVSHYIFVPGGIACVHEGPDKVLHLAATKEMLECCRLHTTVTRSGGPRLLNMCALNVISTCREECWGNSSWTWAYEDPWARVRPRVPMPDFK